MPVGVGGGAGGSGGGCCLAKRGGTWGKVCTLTRRQVGVCRAQVRVGGWEAVSLAREAVEPRTRAVGELAVGG